MYLYKITNNLNGKIYIGIHGAKNLKKSYMGSGKAIKQAINKYGKTNFTKEILEQFDNYEDLLKREREIVNEVFIKREDTYNMIVGGKGVGCGENHPMFGTTRPEHAKWMKNHAHNKGKKCPQHVKDAISKSNKGRKHSNLTNKKKGKSGKENYFYGTQMAKGKRWVNNGIISKLVDPKTFDLNGWAFGRLNVNQEKRVLQIDANTKKIIDNFSSLKEAGEKTGIAASSISSCCNNKLKTAGGYIWKFYE